MKFTAHESFKTQVYFVSQGQELTMLDQEEEEYVRGVLSFEGKKEQIYQNFGPKGSQILLVGLGEESHLTADDYVYAAYQAAKALNGVHIESANIHLEVKGQVNNCQALQAVMEGFLQAEYRFDRYLTDKSSASLKVINVPEKVANLDQLVAEVEVLVEGINHTRDLVNTPSNDQSPAQMADQVKKLLEEVGVEVEVYDKAQIEAMGMKALLAVNAGSVNEPRFLVMKYLPEGEDQKAIALVGKGITYDSGGYALKPADSMLDMKDDMAAAAAVVGTLYALAKNKVCKNVVGIAGLTENLVSATSYKNGDIIGSMKGTTIEVVNTDAEGRVTLADSLYYAATRVNSECVVDLATLTGACLVALGERTSAIMTNNRDLLVELNQAASDSGEPIWELPMTEDLRQKVKGTNGDLLNSAGRFGGTITAGVFLEHFVEGKPWAHLDIAGPAFGEKSYRYLPQGATGVPVKTLYRFVKNRIK